MNNPTFANRVGIKWPIAIMAMNRVSDVNLAVAGAQAGILPSLSMFNYYTGPGIVSVSQARLAIDEFNRITNNAALLMSISVDTLVDNDSFNMLVETGIKVVELVLDSPAENIITEERNSLRDSRIKQLQETGVVVLQKALNIADIEEVNVDGFILKGPDAAGRVINDGDTLLDRIRKCKQCYPNKYVIANGGVGNSAQLKECLEAGADAVGLGTIFAAAAESSLSDAARQKMVEASSEDIRKLTHGAKQNALIFSELEEDQYNNTTGMRLGKATGNKGHIFAGKGIGDIDTVKPVAQIVSELTSLI